MPKKIVHRALFHTLLTAAYVILIASFLFYVPKYLQSNEPDTVLVPVIMLSLLVFSVALTGSLLFGLPVLWYLEGRKKDSLALLSYTLGFFFIFTVLAFVAFLLMR